VADLPLSLDRVYLKKLVFIFLIFLSFSGNAQLLEFGGGGGVLNYSGDLIRGYKITNVRPAFSIHHRMNFSKEVSIKWALTSGVLIGSEAPVDAFSQQRDFNFSLNVAEVSSVIEYHFLDYKHDKSPIKWSPYAFGGAGFVRLTNLENPKEDFNRIQMVIPFGLGFKQLIGKRFSLDTELGVRKTFFDLLDNISEGDLSVKDYQYGNPNDNDWYYYFGVSLSFILYEIPCPFPYVPNKHMLRANFR
jgi:hypothetical protein